MMISDKDEVLIEEDTADYTPTPEWARRKLRLEMKQPT